MAVLKVNFKKHGNGAEKVEKGEFVIEDEVTGRDIDLTADWELCFSPGQRVEMSIIVTEIPATFDKTVANFSPTRATILPYRATAALKPHTQEQITGPNYRSSLLPSKRRLERYDFENLAVYRNVRFRYDGSSGQLPAATKWSWGRTWVEDLGAGNFEARKCRLCPWWFWDSDGRSQHEKYRTCCHFIYFDFLRHRAENTMCANREINCEALAILITLCR